MILTRRTHAAAATFAVGWPLLVFGTLYGCRQLSDDVPWLVVRTLLFPLFLVTSAVEGVVNIVGDRPGLREPASHYLSDGQVWTMVATSLTIYVAFLYAVALLLLRYRRLRKAQSKGVAYLTRR